MDLRLGKNAVIFKDTFCLSKKKSTNGHTIHDTLVYGHWDPLQNWCLLQFLWKCDGFESKYCSALIVLAKIASAKVLIFNFNMPQKYQNKKLPILNEKKPKTSGQVKKWGI